MAAPATTVPCRWPGQTIVCLAGGPSLTDADVDRVAAAEVPTIVVNNAWQLAPWAEVLYAADTDWWRWQAEDGITDDQLPPVRYTLDPLAPRYRPSLRVLHRGADVGLCPQPDRLASGGHSGYQAINLACHLIGFAGQVILLGYDMQPAVDDPQRHHWHPEHRTRRHVHYAAKLPAYAALATALRAYPSLAVVNASRATAIDALPRVALAHCL